MRTLTVKDTGPSFEEGWQELEISKAKYDSYNDLNYIEVWFKGFPESIKLRIYEKKAKDGEEFAIGRLFRFANAGITESLEGTDGSKVLKIDDSAEVLEGSKINVLFYKNDRGYMEIYPRIAPTAFENAADKFTESDVKYWKETADKAFKARPTKDTSNGFVSSSSGSPQFDSSSEDVPF